MAARFLLAMNFKAARDLEQLASICGLVADIAALIHELQKERGASNVYLTSKGAQFADQLARQTVHCADFEQRVIDGFAAIDRLTQGPGLFANVSLVLTDLENLPLHREAVRALKIAPKDSFAFYTTAISNLLAVVASATDSSVDAQISSILIAYVNFMQAKEFAGQERAIGAAGFGAGRFDVSGHRRMTHLAVTQQRSFNVFERYADSAHVAAFHHQLTDDTHQELSRLRNLVYRGGLTGALENVAASDWFAVTTRRIDGLKQIEDRIGVDLKARCAERLVTAKAMLAPSHYADSLLQSLYIRHDLRRRRRAAQLDDSVGLGIRLLATRLATDRRRPANALIETAITLYRCGPVDGGSLAAQQRAEQQAQVERQEMLEDAIYDFGANSDAALATLGEMAAALRNNAHGMSTIASETSERSVEMSAVSRQSVGSIQTVARAAEELSLAIAEINSQADQSYRFATSAAIAADKTHLTVGGLSGAVEQIGEIVGSIKAVAAQTNLLALNATIEAARAGDAGKGFSVVAGEVKALANQTAIAAVEIDRHVASIQSVTTGSIAQVAMICETIKRMDQTIARIAAALTQQKAATERIAHSIQEVSAGTEQASNSIGTVADRAVDAKSMAERVLDAADGLHVLTANLHQGIELFIGKVKLA